MPDFSNSVKRSRRTGTLTAVKTNDISRDKGKLEAKDVINDIYDTRMFKVLKDSAQGLTGARGRRIFERDEIEK